MKRRNFLVTALAGLPLVGGFWKKGTASWREMPVDESAKRWNRLWHASAATMMLHITNKDVHFLQKVGRSGMGQLVTQQTLYSRDYMVQEHMQGLAERGLLVRVNRDIKMRFYITAWRIVQRGEGTEVTVRADMETRLEWPYSIFTCIGLQ